jgi:hypothetical protein
MLASTQQSLQPSRNETSTPTLSLGNLSGPVVYSNVALVAVIVRPKTPFVPSTAIQDRIRRVIDNLAPDRMAAGAVGCIDHVAMSNGKLGLVGVGLALVNPS